MKRRIMIPAIRIITCRNGKRFRINSMSVSFYGSSFS
jgi:hypothetical protein